MSSWIPFLPEKLDVPWINPASSPQHNTHLSRPYASLQTSFPCTSPYVQRRTPNLSAALTLPCLTSPWPHCCPNVPVSDHGCSEPQQTPHISHTTRIHHMQFLSAQGSSFEVGQPSQNSRKAILQLYWSTSCSSVGDR